MRLTYRFVRFLARLIFVVVYGFKVKGADKIPMQGRAIYAANHRSLLDPPAVGVALKREIRYLAKEELFRVPMLGYLIRHLGAIPIKRSKMDIDALRKATSLLENEQALVLFPEGHRSRNGEMQQGLGGVGYLASQTNSPVFPISIRNTYAGERKLFGRNKIEIIVGDRIIYEEPQDNSRRAKHEAYQAFSNKIMKIIASMKANPI
ncbi:hypothetical protein CEE37_08265 [candidate division LCP-89 bacterium B3_LCP]|uniref:Phospholipid/glycerol acyltransferase domain-containing protein n=1 Tax=candidate division LCP-89 bacterium B3_LCP TaxID=2012998 RepID=A0A532UZD0_UNCL8|nr:MAG: hypothetical protein CEE37_08265 [candidate division LCP-89 bacterium B3_LCP]